MDWTDDAIVLSLRRHGESAAIAELLTREHGRHMGLVRGSSRRHGATLQPGSTVRATWRARLEEHLGTWTIEPAKSRAGILLGEAAALAGLTSACAVTSLSLPERENHRPLYNALEVLADAFEAVDVWPALYVRWELGLLAELGFGLELEACAVTGVSEDLTHVSPRTGRAVCQAEAAPYKGRLLALPGFLSGRAARGPADERAGDMNPYDVLDGLALTGHFLETRVWQPHGKVEPEARQRLARRLEKLAQTRRIIE